MTDIARSTVGAGKRISHRNEFELCYLRHKYFKRAKKELTKEDLKLYQSAIEKLSLNNFYLYKSIFLCVGMVLEDILAIAKAHLVTFIGLFSLQADKKKRMAFYASFKNANGRKPNEKDIEQANIRLFFKFLKQRMEDLVRICKQKSAYITGKQYDSFEVFSSNFEPTKDQVVFLKHIGSCSTEYIPMGFRKVSNYSFKKIDKSENSVKNNVYFLDGLWYVKVTRSNSRITKEDLECSIFGNSESIHLKDPETIMIDIEKEKTIDRFKTLDSSSKIEVFKKFIKTNKNNPKMSVEVREAEKQIKRLEQEL